MRLSIVDGVCRPLGGGRYTEHEVPTGLSIVILWVVRPVYGYPHTPDVLDRPEFRELLRAARVAQVT